MFRRSANPGGKCEAPRACYPRSRAAFHEAGRSTPLFVADYTQSVCFREPHDNLKYPVTCDATDAEDD